MAYDRADQSTTRAAEILKYDDCNEDMRVLIDIVLEALAYSGAVLKSNSVATIKADLDTLLSR